MARKGSCHCGKIAYEVEGDFSEILARIRLGQVGRGAAPLRLAEGEGLVLSWGPREYRPNLGKLDGTRVIVIGDALTPGKTREAIESAYRTAFFESTS